METLPGHHLLVEACCLERDVEESGVTESKRPPRDEKRI
jgi:hypothetical protein